MVSNEVTATVSTRGRYKTTMPLMLTSLANQTVKPGRLIIYDDNDTLEDIRELPIYANVLSLLLKKGINWEVKQGARKGQIHNHQAAITDVTSEFIWRLDDDNIMDENVLEGMLNYIKSIPTLGAVGPLILDPKRNFRHSLASSKMEDIFLGLNIQWCDTGLHSYIEVDHLQGSTFLYRKAAAGLGYDLTLSKVGHREETIFTYQMKRNGWQLAVLTGLKTWHMHYSEGGIRSHNNHEMYAADEAIFHAYMGDWNIQPNWFKVIALNNGIGDHYAFLQALPAIRQRYNGMQLIVGACYPETLKNEKGLKVISLDEAALMMDIDQFDIYKWMDRKNWQGSVVAAFEEMYTNG